MANASWYVRREKSIKGPFPWDLIARFQNRGKLLPSDEISTDMQHWAPFSEMDPETWTVS